MSNGSPNYSHGRKVCRLRPSLPANQKNRSKGSSDAKDGTAPESRYMTAAEAAATLNCSKPTISRLLRRDGCIEFFQDGGLLRIDRKSFEDYVARRTFGGGR